MGHQISDTRRKQSMKTETEMEEQKEQKKEAEQIIIPHFDDIKSSYLYWRNYLPETPYQEYMAKKRCVSEGKELLKKIKENKENKISKEDNDEIDRIYEKAKEKLKTAKPGKRFITFGSQDIAGTKYPVYCLKADDAGECHAETERLDFVRMDFKNQQYEKITGELQEVDDEIFNMLVKYDIIKAHRSTIKDILDKKIEERYLKIGGR